MSDEKETVKPEDVNYYRVENGKIITLADDILPIEELCAHLNDATNKAVTSTQLLLMANERLSFYGSKMNWFSPNSLLGREPKLRLIQDGGKLAREFCAQFDIANQKAKDNNNE